MNHDTAALKPRLREFIERAGIEMNTRKKPPIIQCPSPNHADVHPSAVVYDENVHCPVCNKTWDIFDVAGMVKDKHTFPEKIEIVCEVLGLEAPTRKGRGKGKGKEKEPKPIPVTIEKARELFNKDELSRIGKNAGWGDTAVRVWPYFTFDEKIIIADIRFETPGKKKSVISAFFDGKKLRFANAPIVLYNRHLLFKHPSKPVLIVEGAKAAEAARVMNEFIPTTWNGGGKKADRVDWTILNDRDIYIYPDDDQHIDKQLGELKPWYAQDGYLAALNIKKKLPQAKICIPLAAAREIKPNGADIVEALECMSPAELANYILSGPQKFPIGEGRNTDDPYRILGVSDANKAYFLGRHDRLLDVPLTTLNKNHLLNLAPISYWRSQFTEASKDKVKIPWEDAIDYVIHSAGKYDFDASCIRGRGAWREPDGRICYHDGETTIGEWSDHRLYLRKQKKDLGLDSAQVNPTIAKEIADTTFMMSFETKADAIRLLSWSVLAPFAGALPWRPAGLLTGPSGSGKSTIMSMIVEPLALPEAFSGGATSEPGVRQRIQNDAAAIVIEEAEEDTPRKKQFREDLFSLMRQSTSDNAPKAAKGTADGQGMFFSMSSMFLFLAISPEVEAVADDNRIFRINMAEPENEFGPIRQAMDRLMTYRNCQAIRATTWAKLKTIIRYAERLAPIIQDYTGKDLRFGFSDGILLAAYCFVWMGLTDMSHAEMVDMVKYFYALRAPDAKRDETAELVDRLLDERATVEKPERETLSLREILIAIHNQSREAPAGQPYGDVLNGSDLLHWQSVAAARGVYILDGGDLAVCNNHHEVMRILQKGKGYVRQLERHKGLIDGNRSVKMAGKVRRCVVITGVIDVGEGPRPEPEKPDNPDNY